MRVTVIGTGFVGVVSSAVFASFGNDVFGLDVVQPKIDLLKQGKIPFYEPGLQELVDAGLKKKKLHFTTSYEEAISQADVILIAVGTPSAADGQADLKYVFASAESMAPFLKKNAVVALKSTVPPGTCTEVEKLIQSKTSTAFSCVSLPEFLREGTAVQDSLHPDRVVVGASDPQVISMLTELHKPLDAPVIVMNRESAQMCKYTANSYLATRITFINQIANLCEVNGANVQEVIRGISPDKRIGAHYWYPGLGYGGSCFPKDVKELAAYAKAVGQNGNLLVKVSELNEERIPQLMTTYGEKVGSWKEKVVAILGLSFKPNTDDVREAPSTKVVPYLHEQGAKLQLYDPMAKHAFEAQYGDIPATYADSALAAMRNADVVFVLVEWPELISLQVQEIAANLKPNAFFFDVRNQYAARRQDLIQAGIQYVGVGVI